MIPYEYGSKLENSWSSTIIQSQSQIILCAIIRVKDEGMHVDIDNDMNWYVRLKKKIA